MRGEGEAKRSLTVHCREMEEELEDAWRKATYTEREPEGLERLALRTLTQGIVDVFEPLLRVQRGVEWKTRGLAHRASAQQRNALEWILGGQTSPYPFGVVCAELRLSEDRMRDALVERVRRLRRKLNQNGNGTIRSDAAGIVSEVPADQSLPPQMLVRRSARPCSKNRS